MVCIFILVVVVSLIHIYIFIGPRICMIIANRILIDAADLVVIVIVAARIIMAIILHF